MPANRLDTTSSPRLPQAFNLRTIRLLTGCFCLTLLASCGQRDKPPAEAIARPVKVFTVTDGDAASLREFSGRVERTNVSPLAFQVPGRVVEILVLDGRRVVKGQLLARLDAEPFELQLRRAEAQYVQLSGDVQRKAVLHSDGILSDGAFEQLKSALVAAGVARDLARRDLRNTQLVAPFDGRVLQRNVETEQTVQAGAPAMSFESLNRADIGIELPQSLVERLPLNASLHAQAWTTDRPEERIELRYRESSVSAGPQGASYRLIFAVASRVPERLLPGMAVRVRLTTPFPAAAATPASASASTATAATAQTTLPFAALAAAPDGTHRVWRVQGPEHRVHAVTVQPREIHDADGTVAVTGALAPGDMIVAAGVNQLKEGDAVRPLGASR
ncbi:MULTISPECIES: efflux RND transporter periplasmic adaptor subunit [Pandoraea]|uniref:efflux RND transporter periplasmic adaptor subunit n=1 Tax=Pandoraea TaxID=93217 RepID=UPI001F5D3EE0|nr:MULTISPECIES: efflux RND transporter periplasmic adaptor subunit [Pandoraea]MCI3204883.1 efflux RND transporter periplasmic adaptor subunit [Pandoraea sp. LA3]MDN4582911.1 efflux RND transporter periplasmic adaptor subunit [Pandoraea capi]